MADQLPLNPLEAKQLTLDEAVAEINQPLARAGDLFVMTSELPSTHTRFMPTLDDADRSFDVESTTAFLIDLYQTGGALFSVKHFDDVELMMFYRGGVGDASLLEREIAETCDDPALVALREQAGRALAKHYAAGKGLVKMTGQQGKGRPVGAVNRKTPEVDHLEKLTADLSLHDLERLTAGDIRKLDPVFFEGESLSTINGWHEKVIERRTI